MNNNFCKKLELLFSVDILISAVFPLSISTHRHNFMGLSGEDGYNWDQSVVQS